MVVLADAPRVAVRTLGCKVNRADSEALAEALLPLGVVIGGDSERADAIVVNTCTVTAEADAKARKEVRRALAATTGPVVVTGCLATLDAEGLRALGERVVVVTDRDSLPETVGALLGTRAGKNGAMPGTRTAAAAGTFRTRALLKVQDGCDNRCAYCIVPDARGGPRSVPAGSLVRRVESLAALGVAEIVLTGVNLGRYRGGGEAADLASLIELLSQTSIARIRLSSIEPPDLSERLLAVLARSGHVATHLHVPLQSGSDRTLIAMRRRYDTAAYADALARARAAVPGLVVTTDVIAGFPGESEADAADSLEFAGSCGFAKLHVFRYSKRAGTPAAAAEQVAAPAKAARARALRDLSDRMEHAHALSRAGQRAHLLVEAVRDGVAHGTTEDHLHLWADAPGANPGDLIAVDLALSDDGGLRGYYVGEARSKR